MDLDRVWRDFAAHEGSSSAGSIESLPNDGSQEAKVELMASKNPKAGSRTTAKKRPVKAPAADGAPVITEDEVDDVDEGAEILPIDGAITSYGADYPVDGLVKRIEQGDIVVPTFDPEVTPGGPMQGFQRKLVWSRRQAERFIESLLLGFPVPGIFLVKQPNGVLLVLDGAQRLRTLQSFYKGVFRGQEFKLEEVQTDWQDKGYDDLDPADRRRLDNSIIHATVIKQDEDSDHESVYLIFERLNTGGTLLQPQEIRVALYSGPFVEVLRTLNDHPSWRTLFGKKSPHLKDHELILRVFAMMDRADEYKRPMKEFLNEYMKANRQLEERPEAALEKVFKDATDTILTNIGDSAFRLKKNLNAAVAESILVAVANGRVRQPDGGGRDRHRDRHPAGHQGLSFPQSDAGRRDRRRSRTGWRRFACRRTHVPTDHAGRRARRTRRETRARLHPDP